MPALVHPVNPEPEYIDPRVRRTRQMLEQALENLLAAKAFEKISVGDIAEAATLNRATFYGHFIDKYELLEGLVASRFQDLLDRRGVAFDGQCASALYGIALAVCDFLADMPFCPGERPIEQHLESAMVAIVRRMLADGLSRHPPASALAPEMVAAALAGAIYGSARQWVRLPQRPSAEQAAASITALLQPILTR